MEEVLHGTWGKRVWEVDAPTVSVREVEQGRAGRRARTSSSASTSNSSSTPSRLLETELRNRRQTEDTGRWRRTPDQGSANRRFVYKFATSRSSTTKTACRTCRIKAPAGSLVIENYQNGQVVAMASYPTFDNRWFNVGLNEEKFDQLFPTPAKDDPNRADKSILVNRAVQGQYNLGSTFKPFIAWSAMHSGIIRPDRDLRGPGHLQAERSTRRSATRACAASS